MTANYRERSMRLLLTCGLDVNAAGGSFHETRGHVVLGVLLREPGVLVAHQPVLQHGSLLGLQTINRRCFHNHRDGPYTMITNMPVPYDLCIGVPISHLHTVG